MDAVQQATSGHLGTPMALALVVYMVSAALPALRLRRLYRSNCVTIEGHAALALDGKSS